MPTGLLPTPAPAGVVPTDPQAVVEAFLAALVDLDVDAAMALLDDDVAYTNVGLPTIHGKQRVAKVFAGLDRPGAGFEAYLHAGSAEGSVVLNERTDVIVVGRFRAQFWVAGRFDVHDGKITRWRDAFDYLDIARAVVRGLIGTVVPSLRPAPPTSLDVAPGR